MADKFWDAVQKIGVSLVFVLGGVLVGHEIRISKIEETRFTNLDGELLRKEIVESLPPKWLREQIAEMRADLKRIADRLAVLEAR